MGKTDCETWGLYRREDDQVLKQRNDDWKWRNGNGRAKSNGHTNGKASTSPQPQPSIDWNAKAREFAAKLTDERRRELATTLSVPVKSIAEIDSIGWSETGWIEEDGKVSPCWTFPLRDGFGSVVGINRRHRDGRKKVMKDAKQGLTVPEFWDRGDGPIFLPEGQSNTLVLIAAGLAGFGRPSNLAGVEYATELLKNVPASRPIIVVGDNDQRFDGKTKKTIFPGQTGAVKTAAKLTANLNRPVLWVTPGFQNNDRQPKDIREWSRWEVGEPDEAEGSESDAEWAAFGELVTRSLLATAKAASPGPPAASNGTYPGSVPSDASAESATVPPTDGYQFLPIDTPTFFAADYRMEWLVSRVLVAGQLAVIGGASKTLKTSLAVDLALSIGSATPFLGHFPVYKKARVCLISGESGEFTLQETARRVAAAKGIGPADADVMWGFRLPQLGRVADLAAIGAGIRENAIKVLIVDPTYLCLLAGVKDVSAANIFEIGPLIGGFDRVCKDAGATPILLHHFVKSTRAGQELSLTDLSFSGFAEYARQFVLIGRRNKYEPGTGLHELTMEVGGSAGQSCSVAIDVNEGQLQEDFTGRKWEVAVRSKGEFIKDQSSVKEQHRKEKAAQKLRDQETEFLIALDAVTTAGTPPTLNAVRAELGWNGDVSRSVFSRLQTGKFVETHDVKVKNGKGKESIEKGIRRCKTD